MDYLTERVINWCNEFIVTEYKDGIHYEQLLDMPDGIPSDPQCCPIANACGINAEVYHHFITGPESGTTYEVPGFVVEWVAKYDNGDYPEYIQDDWSAV